MASRYQRLCRLCKEVFESRYLAYLHVWVQHPNIHPAAIANELLPVDPLAEGRYRVYQVTLDLLAKQALNLCQRQSDDKLSRDSYDFLAIWNRQAGNPMNLARLVARGFSAVQKLPAMLPRLAVQNKREVEAAVEADTEYVVRILKALHAHSEGQDAVIALGEDATLAASFLALVGQIDKAPKYWPIICGINPRDIPSDEQARQGNEFRRHLLYLSIKVAQMSDQLPESIFITGVRLKSATPVGGGAFADIFYGEYDGKLVAIKKLRAFLEDTEVEREKMSRDFCREAMTWKLLFHPHILEFCGVSQDLYPNTLCMVSVWLNNGNLIQYIKNLDFIEHEVHRLLHEAASGLAYLHGSDAQIVHGDLRGANILIDDGGHARLCDFGLSNFYGLGNTIHSRSAMTTWTPPECIDPRTAGLATSRPIPPSDIFAFAGVCWEVYNDRPPFADLRQAQAITLISRSERPFQSASRRPIPLDLWALICNCWQHDFRLRPDAKQVAFSCELIIQNITPITLSPSSSGDTSSKYPSDATTSDSSDKTARPSSSRRPSRSTQRSSVAQKSPQIVQVPRPPSTTPRQPTAPQSARAPTTRQPSVPTPPPASHIAVPSSSRSRPPRSTPPHSDSGNLQLGTRTFLSPKPVTLPSRTQSTVPAPVSHRAFSSRSQYFTTSSPEPVPRPSQSTPRPILRPQRSSHFERTNSSSMPDPDGHMRMPEPWSAIPYQIRRPPSQQRVHFDLPSSTSSSSTTMQENASASGSGSDTLTGSEESSETATTTDSDTTIHPRLYQRLQQLTINERSHNSRTRRRRSPPEELPPVPIASDTDSADESRKPARSSRPTTPTTPLRSVPSYTFSNPVQVAAATHPILIPVPIAQFPPIPTPCDGSCYYYNPLLCPLHGPSLAGTPMMPPFGPRYF